MSWQIMETFPYPDKLWVVEQPRYLLCNKDGRIVIGVCDRVDNDPVEYRFSYDRDDFEIVPTHWMPLPEKPNISK